MKIDIPIIEAVEIITLLSKIQVTTIENYQNLLIVDYVKNEKITIIKKIEHAKDSFKKDIKLKFGRATASALYHWLISYNYNSIEQANRFGFIAMEIHKQLINSLSAELFEIKELENNQYAQLKK